MSEGADRKQAKTTGTSILTQEQETILELYLQRLDTFYEELKASEVMQAEIETLHLKKILTK